MIHPGRLLFIMAAGVTALVGRGPCAHAAPNVVLILADDAGYADFGFMNQFTGQSTEFKTPNLDALAQQSVVFSNAYVSSSGCSPSRAGMLTGRYQQKFGMDYNINSTSSPLVGVPTSELMMPQRMKDLGYSTGMVGKWHIGLSAAQLPNEKGFDSFYGFWESNRPFFDSDPDHVKIRRGTAPAPWQQEASFNNVEPDPVLGRHVTDAFGDEASQYIAEHANQPNPFFLYVSFNAPHSPYTQAKQQDLDQFESTSLTGLRKNAAALTYGMDRNIGSILARLDDPNGDGDTSDSIANDTIVVFSNDNGGNGPNDPVTLGQRVHDNGALRDWKGFGFEGGIRVPMLMRLPNSTPQVSNEPVIALDLLPTFLEAAGGTIPDGLDGKSLLPLFDGTQVGALHDALFWRGGLNHHWAIRKGAWKLAKGSNSASPHLYQLNPDGSGETTLFDGEQPEVYEQLLREFVNWEVTLAKPTQTDVIALNRFDAFRYRHVHDPTSTWLEPGTWANDADPAITASMMSQDPYANAVVVFQPHNDADFTATNNVRRITGFREFVLNELRLDGDFAGDADRSGTIDGNELMFVKSMTGRAPRLQLGATQSGEHQFTFNVNMDVILHDDLEITGDGAGNYVVNGQISDFDAPRSITKSGAGVVTFTGNNTYAGETTINQGTLRIEGPAAALANSANVHIGPQGTLELTSGLIRTSELQIAQGGQFVISGGTLEAAALILDGGEFRPGMPGAITAVEEYTQNEGTLSLEIAGTAPGSFTQLSVTRAQLNSELKITLADSFFPTLGDVFEIITAPDGVTGEFDSLLAPTLPIGLKWSLQYVPDAVSLNVVADSLRSDFDNNNVVDGADLGVWMSEFEITRDGNDFLNWQRELGAQITPPPSPVNAIPEPSAVVLAGIALLLAATPRRFCGAQLGFVRM
jgi:autotransporter-associated beta strand protein